jgi:anaerobic selenocysteine-containing dehydrogenase
VAQKHYTTCSLCEATCGLVVETEGKSVVSIRGDDDDPFSRGYLCPKAIALQDLYDDPDRLKTPVRRTPDGWEPIGWDEAFDEAVRGIRDVQARCGRDSLAVYHGNPTVHSLGAMTTGQLFFGRVRTRNRYSATSADQLPHMLAGLLMFGHQLLLPVPDVDRTDFMLILGGNPVVSNGSLMTAPDIKKRLEAIRARGGTLVVVDPRRTETAAIADRHLFIRPGTDALLLLAMLHTMFGDELVDLGRLAAFTDGVDDLRGLVRRFAPDEVAAAVGIAAGDIRGLARDFAAAPSAVCYGRVGLCTQEFGGLAAWLVNAVNIVTGNLDRAGGAMFATPAFDLVSIAARGGRRGSFARWHSRVRGLPEFGGEVPVSTLADEILTEGPNQVRAVITSAGNPVLSTPNGDKLDRALDDVEFMVSIDPYINETTRHADIILPPTTPLERDHYDVAFGALMVRNTAKFSPAVFPREPDQRHDWEIALELWSRWETDERSTLGRIAAAGIRALGSRVTPRVLVDAAVRFGPHKLSLKKLLDAPHGIDLGPLQPRFPELLYTEPKRIALAPEPFVDDIDRLVARTGELAAPHELRLIGRRHLRSNNSWMHNSYRLVKGKPRCTLLVHPGDAKTHGLTGGKSARITSAAGSVVVQVEVSEDMMPGVVSLPHGWGHARDGVELSVAGEHAGVSVNSLTDDAVLDEMSGNAVFSGVPVRVEAL